MLANALRVAVYFVALLIVVLGFVPSVGAQRKVIRLEAIKVEGRIQKPQAFYILQRSNLRIGDDKPEASFIPKIIESVEEQPF